MSAIKKRANTNASHKERVTLEDISNKRPGMTRLEKSTKILTQPSQENKGPCKGTRLQTKNHQIRTTKTTRKHDNIALPATSNAINRNTNNIANGSDLARKISSDRNQPSVLVSQGRESLDLMDVEDDDFETFPRGVTDIDQDHSEPLFVSLYANEIYTTLKTNEVKYKPTDYMTIQADISPDMRSILIDWLVEVADEYKLASETLYLCVNYIDRYLSCLSINKKIMNRVHLQLLGIVCMFIASKFEEIYAPPVDEFVYISDNTYSKEQMFGMEEIILATLKFHLCTPTIKVFLRRYLKAANASSEVTSLANFLCELSLQDYSYTKYLASVVAISAVCLSLHAFGLPCWTPTMEYYSGYKCNNSTMQDCIKDLFRTYASMGASPLKAIKEKYFQPKYFKVSSLRPPSTLPYFVN